MNSLLWRVLLKRIKVPNLKDIWGNLEYLQNIFYTLMLNLIYILSENKDGSHNTFQFINNSYNQPPGGPEATIVLWVEVVECHTMFKNNY